MLSATNPSVRLQLQSWLPALLAQKQQSHSVDRAQCAPLMPICIRVKNASIHRKRNFSYILKTFSYTKTTKKNFMSIKKLLHHRAFLSFRRDNRNLADAPSMKLFTKQVRGLMGICMMVSTIVAGSFSAPSVRAETPPQQKVQAPGYFRMALGQFQVTALYDGFVDIDASLLSGASKKAIQSSLEQSFLTSAQPAQTAVNAYLINTNKNLILIDTGTAKLFGPNLGFMPENLRAAGYQPAQVDTIFLTHLHPDHAGGLLTPTGEMVFPNAQVFVSRAEANYWLDETIAANASKDKQALFKMSRDAVAPYLAAGKLTIFEPGQALPDGVTEMPTAGHTPGHTGYLVSSEGQNLLVWGDIVHSIAVQFPHPEVAIEFDSNQKQAVATRRRILALAASRKIWIAGAHMPFPGIGRVRSNNATAYVWVPAAYHQLHDAH
ncbi:MAG: MBL fold metallo-hydrolase [Burkholderiaceae bacterium]